MAIWQLGIDSEECRPEVYATFITELRKNARESFYTHESNGTDYEVGILKHTRDRISDVGIAVDGNIFFLHIQNYDVYFLGYKLPTCDDWVSIAEARIPLNGKLAKYATGFKESYRGMGLPDAINLATTRLGFNEIRKAMRHLKRFTAARERTTLTQLKKACAVVVLMICEAARCETVFTELQNVYIHGGKLQTDTAELIKDWDKQCLLYHKAGDYCGPLRLVKHKDPPPEVVKGKNWNLHQKLGKVAKSASWAFNQVKGKGKGKMIV